MRELYCVYMLTILIFGTNLMVIEEVNDFLNQSIEMKDLEVIDFEHQAFERW